MQKRLQAVTDGAGQLIAIADSAGEIDASYAGSGYGQTSWRGAGVMTRGQTFSPRRWETDAQWGEVQQFRNRAYDPGSGRWLQEDPIGVAGGINLYEYNGNDPVTWRDPFGLCPMCIIGGAVALFEAASSAYDAYQVAKTLNDPSATAGQKAGTVGLAFAGVVLPGGGYTAGKSAGKVVIGETMTRVEGIAARVGAGVFETSATTVKQMWKENSTWLRGAMRDGKQVIDIGLDPGRAVRSKFYQAEQELLKRRGYPSVGGNE